MREPPDEPVESPGLDRLEQLFTGDPAEVVEAKREHFRWLADSARREHDPAKDWPAFVEELWQLVARWQGLVEDEPVPEGVREPWVVAPNDSRVEAWYDQRNGPQDEGR
ncbi:hypothetical protein BH20ACT9_BH20ACT9_07350 [soil metagenome]